MRTAAAQVWVTAPAAWADWQRRVGELDVVERARLASLRPPDTARAYAVLHLLARDVLAGVVGGSPAGIVMTRSCTRCGADHGPPRLVGHPALHVSLSRTTGLVIVATTVREPSPGQARTVLPGHPPVIVLDVPLDAVPGTQGYVAALAVTATRADHDPRGAVEPVPDSDVLEHTTAIDTIGTVEVVVHAGACRGPR